MYRRSVNKRRSARQFRRNTMRTKRINVAPGLARGGIAL